MLPAVLGSSVGVFVAAAEVLMIAGTAGMGYGLGRKYGRKACEVLDHFEQRMFTSIKSRVEAAGE